MKYLLLSISILSSTYAMAWREDLRKSVQLIDEEFPGAIGLVVRDLRDGSELSYQGNKDWYLSSTMKVIIAISLLEEVEAGHLSLDQKVTLQTEEFVDGAGPLLWRKPGEKFSVARLLEFMLRESDNTAADMLIELVGPKKINDDFQKWMGKDKRATTLLEVRYHTYSELHPKAQELSNMDFIKLKNAPLEKRHLEFAKKIKTSPEELNSQNLEEAHEKFYARGYNSADLESYVQLLAKLSQGKLLSMKHTDLILNHMEHMKTGEHRIKARLSHHHRFMQKTGTQVHRACNLGLIQKASEEKPRIALAVCITKPSEDIDSDLVFRKIGQALESSPLLHD